MVNVGLERAAAAERERAALQNHSVYSQTLASLVDPRPDIGAIIRAHHEHYNGQGFPDKLTGEAIPVGARIVAIAEAYEELTTGEFSTRPKTSEEAISVITKAVGIYFCPVMVGHFVNVITAASH